MTARPSAAILSSEPLRPEAWMPWPSEHQAQRSGSGRLRCTRRRSRRDSFSPSSPQPEVSAKACLNDFKAGRQTGRQRQLVCLNTRHRIRAVVCRIVSTGTVVSAGADATEGRGTGSTGQLFVPVNDTGPNPVVEIFKALPAFTE